MANQRGTFGKRNREMKLKDRQREKADRLAQRRAEQNRETKGPQIAWDEAGGVGSLPEPEATPPTTTTTTTTSDAAPSTPVIRKPNR